MGLGDLECCLHVECCLPVHAQNFSTTGVCWDSERTALVPGSNSDRCTRDSDRHVCSACPTAQVRGAGFSKFTEDQRTLGGSQTRPAISLAVRVPWADSPAREWPWGDPVLTFLSRAVSLTTKASRIHSGDYRSEFVTPCLLNHPWNDCSTKQETEATGSRSGSCSKTWL